MKTSLKPKLIAILLLLSTLSPQLSTGFAQGTAFTYQGRLNDGANPASGIYDLRFAIYDSLTGGTQQGSPLTNATTSVSNGLFTVTLDFGNQFPGADRWLEIGVRTNGVATFANLIPRQKITPSPYATYAAGASAAGISGTIPTANLTGTYGSAVTFSNPANSFSGNGTGLTNVNAATLGGMSASSFWNLGGNAGATPGSQFLGTSDNLPMELKVNGARALRLEPNPNAPNVIGGSAANEVTNGIYGAVIAGGGSTFYPNRVGAIFATVVGGNGNTASGNFATAMGEFNTASGYAGTAMGYSTVAGGFGSQAGGVAAKANHDGTFVWADDTFADFTSTAANQFLIRAAGGVGINNNNPNGAALAVNGNVTVNGSIGTPGNQPLELKANNQRGLRLEPTAITDSVNVIGGSARNFVGAGIVGATIGGGGSGIYFGVASTNRVECDFGTVSGGAQNTILGNSGNATIGGGEQNTILGNSGNATIGGGEQNAIKFTSYATIAGGNQNLISGAYTATIGGGFQNSIGTNSIFTTIGGGVQNYVQNNASYATIGGGYNNLIGPDSYYATIPGGRENYATAAAFAAGTRAKAYWTGSFVWADSTEADFQSTGPNQFVVRASGGVGIGVYAPQQQLSVASGANIDQDNANSGTVANALTFGSASGEGIGSKRNAGVNQFGLDFYTGSASRMAILNTGNLGIGTTAPEQLLQVGDPNLASGSQGMMRFGSHSATQPYSRYWDIGVPKADGNATGQNYSFVIDDPQLGAGPEFVIRYDSGNVGIGTTSPSEKLHVIGNILASGTVNGGSDRNVKEHFSPVNPREVLEKVSALPITEWNYITDGETLRHIGPMAQDFYSAFNVGMDDKHISMVDADGVALAAIQGLNQKLEETRAELRRRDADNAELRQSVNELKKLVTSMAQGRR